MHFKNALLLLNKSIFFESYKTAPRNGASLMKIQQQSSTFAGTLKTFNCISLSQWNFKMSWNYERFCNEKSAVLLILTNFSVYERANFCRCQCSSNLRVLIWTARSSMCITKVERYGVSYSWSMLYSKSPHFPKVNFLQNMHSFNALVNTLICFANTCFTVQFITKIFNLIYRTIIAVVFICSYLLW